LSPLGIVKLKTAALVVPAFVTEAVVPALPVVVVPALTVAAVPVAPVAPLAPATEKVHALKVPEPPIKSTLTVMEVFRTTAVTTPSSQFDGEAVLATLTLVPTV
jgi:hypothetical protein